MCESVRQDWPAYRCPYCTEALRRFVIGEGRSEHRQDPSLRCPSCGRSYSLIDGIWRLIPAAELARLQPFIDHYRRVRRAEDWVPDPALLPRLPYAPASSHHVTIWRRRARSFERLLAVLTRIGTDVPMRIVDLGAGNCWLSGQLARRGYRVEALDVNVDDEDGLAAARHLLASALAVPATPCPRVAGHGQMTFGAEVCGVPFGRVQSSLEWLPYLDCQFDAVVAAASVHYAFDLDAAVEEAARVLRLGGALILLDTPLYRHDSAGQALVRRRIADHRRLYGSDGTGVTGRAYLDVAALRRAMARAGLTYREVPVHGAVRALLGKWRRAARTLRCREERAQMPLVVGVRPC